jgi:hypothetical protein
MDDVRGCLHKHSRTAVSTDFKFSHKQLGLGLRCYLPLTTSAFVTRVLARLMHMAR